MDEAIKALVTELRKTYKNSDKGYRSILFALRQEWQKQDAADKAQGPTE